MAFIINGKGREKFKVNNIEISVEHPLYDLSDEDQDYLIKERFGINCDYYYNIFINVQKYDGINKWKK